MTRKKFTQIVIGASIILVILLAVLLSMLSQNDSDTGSPTSNRDNYNPFLGPDDEGEGSSSSGGFFGGLFGRDDEPGSASSSGGASGSSSSGGSTIDPSGSGLIEGDIPIEKGPRLKQLTNVAVSGMVAFTREGKEYVRYAERDTGHIYEVDPYNLSKIRLSPHTIPGVHEAIWSGTGDYVVYRYFDETESQIKSYMIDLTGYSEGEDYTLEGEFLPDNIKEITSLAGADRMLYITKENDAGIIYTVNLSDLSIAQRALLPVSEWIPEWISPSTAILTTKASQKVPGLAYTLDIQSGTLTKILGDIDGLTTLVSPDGDTVLYSESTRALFSMKRHDVATNSTESISRASLPMEKCAWSDSETAYCGIPGNVSNGIYPDDWYKGQAHFQDTLYSISNDSSDATFEIDPVTSAQAVLNVSKPFISEDNGEHFIFVNRIDSTLWSYRFKE